ncbi:MAG: hypothetical protein K2X43_03985 [Hyphomonadaceae bacterium]|nr:hypothetical protein [Hyphomonadaceae bacterium]
MRWHGVLGRIGALALMASLDSHPVRSAPALDLQRDGALAIAGRSLRCGSVRNVLDPRLPNLGLAAPGVVVFNPRLLSRQSDTVRLFVFHHECGHHHVGGSEIGADCWAVKQGVQGGWLDSRGLGEVCRSFGNAPPTPTHPSAASRCASLRVCFANAAAAQAGRTKVLAARATTGPRRESAAPRLISGPTLLRDGLRRSLQ